ncbi:MAG: hypothetical protein EOP04_09645 [Proteobacteria bacterium]|nr:MAG: hypothetical protein EOP04_09645 [Pseudomonadota bacterium]
MQVVRPYNNFQAVGVYGGGNVPPNPRDWRFSCKSRLSGNLFELWHPYDSGRKYYLHSFNLNIYDIGVSSTDPPKFVFLHADPEVGLKEAHGPYKKGPHLHIEVENTIWPDVHLGLNVGNLRECTSSEKNLTIALRHAIRMIEEATA